MPGRRIASDLALMDVIGLRSVAFRVLSASKTTTPSLACRTRSITTAISSSPSRYRLTTQSPIFSLQRRFASEEAQTQSEPTADREAEAQHGDNSIAAASQKQSSEQSVEDVAEESGREAGSTLGEIASAAAAKAKETATDAFGSVAEGNTFGSSFRKWDAAPVSSVYIGNLFFDVKEQDLREEFSKCGEIESIKLIMDNRGLSKGFGYVNFMTVDAASAAIRDYDNTPFSGRRLSVQYAKPRTPPTGAAGRPVNRANEPTRTLFIGNMSFDMSDRELNQLFREVRNVVDVRVAIDRRTGQPRGFAHADFTDVDSAKEAMLALSGKEVSGRQLRVDYSISSGSSGERR
ncbi:MAG: hypothetical protein LQ350_004251 [Teloschistes chrysophthalmus]|nr:MAG: hypothetical protein LQ350_004251 [Niorma chrysophthalma]